MKPSARRIARAAQALLVIASACGESSPSTETTPTPPAARAPRPEAAPADTDTPTAAEEGASPAASAAEASAGGPGEAAVELVALRRAVVHGLVADDAAFAARYIPFVVEGVADGVRVFGIRPGSGLALLGLMNGDQVRGVGGEPVLDLTALRALPSRLLVEADIDVVVVRRGVALELRYRITD